MSAVPLLGDLPLEHVQRIEHHLDAGFVGLAVPGLPGEVQQRFSRRSHHVCVRGLLFGEGAAEALQGLQEAAAAGEELTFAADIATALELQKVVVTRFAAAEEAGRPGLFVYQLEVAESPPLPEPATLEAFGGLDDFGLGDLGFDTDILGDLRDLAGEIAGAVDAAMGALDALQSLASLDGLSLGGMLEPIQGTVDTVTGLGERFVDAVGGVTELFGS